MHLRTGIDDTGPVVQEGQHPVAAEFVTFMAAPLSVTEDDELLITGSSLCRGLLNGFFRLINVPDAGCSVHAGKGTQPGLGLAAFQLTVSGMPPNDIAVVKVQLVSILKGCCHAHQNGVVVPERTIACDERNIMIVCAIDV